MGSLMNRSPMIPMEFRELVKREVADGERILWFGSASQSPLLGGILFAFIAAPLIAFSLFFAFVAAVVGMVFRFRLMIFLVPLIVIAVGAVLFSVGKTILGSRRAKKNCYILTDRRAIVIDAGVFGGKSVASFKPERLTTMTRIERNDGSGDLIFEEFTTPCGMGDNRGYSITRRGFINIGNVREVEQLVNQMIDDNRAASMEAAD